MHNAVLIVNASFISFSGGIFPYHQLDTNACTAYMFLFTLDGPLLQLRDMSSSSDPQSRFIQVTTWRGWLTAI